MKKLKLIKRFLMKLKIILILINAHITNLIHNLNFTSKTNFFRIMNYIHEE